MLYTIAVVLIVLWLLGFAPSLWNVNKTYDVSIDDKPFRLRIVEIGQVDERGDKQAYCDIEVEAVADI